MTINTLLIEPSELNTLIEKGLSSNICIVDLSSEASYSSGHIPGAVFLPYQALLNGQPPTPGKLPSVEQLQRVFTYLGMNEDTHFIVYDDEGGGWAGRFIWTLDVIHHRKYSYVNGGILAWKKEGYAVERTENKPEETSPDITIHTDPIAEIPNIMEGIKNKTIKIWDARSPEEFLGTRVAAAKSGHIPGAINCEWTSLMDPQQGLKIRADAKEILKSKSLDGSQPIITHCQTHHRSGFTYLLGRILGFDIKGYHGSWAEWGNHPDTPVER